MADAAAGEIVRRAPTQLSIWTIGQGFEGTASDWTEYVVWLVGVMALVWFIWSRNVMALPSDSEIVGFGDEFAEDDDDAAAREAKEADGKEDAEKKDD